MPNRIIKESLCRSEKIAALNDFEFRVWIGLIVSADDMGRGDARPAIIKGSVFPLRERVALRDIDAAVHGLAGKGCIVLYEVDGRSYFYFPTWGEHQRIRQVKPKFPEPPTILTDSRAFDNLPQSAASCGELRPESNPIQSESNPNPIQERGAQTVRFSPPTLDEIRAYCLEADLKIDPAVVFDHYSANGWVQNKGKPIKDWKAACRLWARREKEFSHPKTGDKVIKGGSDYELAYK